MNPQRILRFTAYHFGRSITELLSPDTSYPLSRQRQICYWLLRQHCDLSYPQIGKIMGREHTTILHGVRVIDRKYKTQYSTVRRDIHRIQILLATGIDSPLGAKMSVQTGTVTA